MQHEDIKCILEGNNIGNDITICGWIKKIRDSKNICFIEINDGTTFKNLQLVLDKSRVENQMFLEEISIGTSIVVNGIVNQSLNKNQNFEMNVCSTKIIGKCPKDFPIQNKKQNMEYLRDLPHLRSRTNTFNAVFRIRSVLSNAIHNYFQENNFTYVNTPIISDSNFEGAGEMFKVTTLNFNKLLETKDYNNIYSKDFFGKNVGLTLSGQLEAEAMSYSFGKVYNFGPAFRADNSNTKRHAAEFWLIESEISFADIEDVILIINDIIKYLIKKVNAECANEIEFFNEYYDNNLKNKLNEIINNDFDKIDYTDALEILINSKVNFEFPIYWGCILRNEHIRYLTDVVFKKPIFIMNSPKEQKPFYIKENEDGKTVASADLFFPGIGDIIGASQKEDDLEALIQRIENLNMTKEDYLWYLDLRKYGNIPHSGFGMGLDRLLMYITGLENIRDTIPFPRTKCKNLKI